MSLIDKRSKDKQKLINVIEKEVTQMFEGILNVVEVVALSDHQYTKLRGKILRSGNDCKRKLSNIIDNEFSVKYEPPNEDIIQVINRNTGK